MKKIFYISVLSILSIVSCSDEVTETTDEGIATNEVIENNVTSIEDYFDFLTTDTDGTVVVQSISTALSGEAYKAISSIKGDKTPLTLKVDEKTVSFTNRDFSSVANKSYSNVSVDNLAEVFGSTFKVEFGDDQLSAKSNVDKSSDEDSTESVYIPGLVNAEFTGLEDGKIIANSLINWNADDQNTNGVVISIEYSPLSQPLQSVLTQNPAPLMQAITTEDDGSYTISTKDLADFPQNALLTFYVARAGYGISTNDAGEDYSLAGLTVNRTDFTISK
ncbi:MAG: hypothetical protein ABJL44_14610 [Algibacter sp.]